MRAAEKTAIDDAIAALQPFYEAGDDGYPVSLALDALAGVLGEKAKVDIKPKDGLVDLLKEVKAPAAVRAGVEKLYENGAGGEYGVGLSKKQAAAINDLVETILDELIDLIRSYTPRRGPRSGSRPKRGAKQSKKLVIHHGVPKRSGTRPQRNARRRKQ